MKSAAMLLAVLLGITYRATAQAPALDPAEPAPTISAPIAAAEPVAAPQATAPATIPDVAPAPAVAVQEPPATTLAQAAAPQNPASAALPPATATAPPAAANPAPAPAAASPATPANAPANNAAAPTPNPATGAAQKPSAPDGPKPPTVVMNTQPTVPGGAGSGLSIQGLPGQSVPWSIVILLTGLTLIPTMIMCVTPFARLLIVFHFLRQALGLQTTPSNQTLIGLSLILTFFLMQPIGVQIYEASIAPMQSGQITAMEALGRGEAPMRKFMAHYVRDKDVALFVELAKEPAPHSPDDLSMRVLLPAYMLSELKAGFQIGTVLFLPFLIVDMVVASITTSVGMLQLPPVVISTPLKLLLFLMVDGWHLLIGSLMRSFS
jgi:flagellar biosynthetic protein FliP